MDQGISPMGDGAMGVGFYLTADPNEAKCYACGSGKPTATDFLVLEIAVPADLVGKWLKGNHNNKNINKLGDDTFLRDIRAPHQIVIGAPIISRSIVLNWHILPLGFEYLGHFSMSCSSLKMKDMAHCDNPKIVKPNYKMSSSSGSR